MSDHLPECYDALIPDFHNERWVCICAALRACEQRVREGWYEVQSKTWEEGYKHGLDAARAAIAAIGIHEETHLWHGGHPEYLIGFKSMREQALASIDALRQERSGNPDTPPPVENPDN